VISVEHFYAPLDGKILVIGKNFIDIILGYRVRGKDGTSKKDNFGFG
jgi:hypothetical protein